ncbi:MAG: cobyrinate a,c-diamide synthase [Nitrospirae bacterium]|nr:cobyrinate a,c-diamide synthase [Nitrospirota bacterium]
MIKGAFIIAAPSSGSGKTTVTLALMAALRARGLAVQPFKCGPDFIDPTLHRAVTGRVSRNLDIRMCGEAFARECFARNGADADVSVIEGVMGMFDGGASSTAALAKLLDIPVVLVLDAGKMAESAAAVVKGFESLEPEIRLAGVVMNRIGSERHMKLVRDAVAAHCKTQVLGKFPKNAKLAIPERHLGLHMGHENLFDDAKMAEAAESGIDIDALLNACHSIFKSFGQPVSVCSAMFSAPPGFATPLIEGGLGGVMELSIRNWNQKLGVHAGTSLQAGQAGQSRQTAARIAVAMDDAFCFHYPDNLDMLEAFGAEIVPFSPLADDCLPSGIDGVYLPGGYPELRIEKLSDNRLMLKSINEWVMAGGVCYAECGGFMYLCEGMDDANGMFRPLAGAFPVRPVMKPKLAALGYREIETVADTFFGPAGTRLRGHEFHYSETGFMPESVERVYIGADGFRVKNTIGSYVHIHFGSNPEAAKNFVAACNCIGRGERSFATRKN